MRNGPMNQNARRLLFFKGPNCCVFATVLFVLSATSEPVSAKGRPATEDSFNKCYKPTDSGSAITYCTQAIESWRLSGKRLAFAFYRRANAYNVQGNYDRAIKDYDEAIRLNPRHANAFSNRGVAFAAKRNYDRAIQSYNEAIRLNPQHADAFSNRGVAYARKGDFGRAIQNYDEAIRLNPNHAHALFDRGNAYRLKKDYDHAIKDYDEAIRLNPRHVNAFSNRGVAYSYKGEHDLAIRSFDEALRLNPSHLNALYNRGNAYTRMGAYDHAIKDYDQVLQLKPQHSDAYSSRGIVRFLQGQFSAAEPDLSKAVRLAPNNPYRILLLYLARARAGNVDREGLAHAARRLDLKNWPGPIVSMYLGKVSGQDVLAAVADVDVAQRSQRRCQASFYLGQQLLIQRQSDAAAKMFRAAVTTNASTLFEYEAAQAELKRLGH